MRSIAADHKYLTATAFVYACVCVCVPMLSTSVRRDAAEATEQCIDSHCTQALIRSVMNINPNKAFQLYYQIACLALFKKTTGNQHA